MILKVHRDDSDNLIVTANGERLAGLFEIIETLRNHSHVLTLHFDADQIEFINERLYPPPPAKLLKKKKPRRKK